MEILTVTIALLPFVLLARVLVKKRLGSLIDGYGVDILALAGGLGYLSLAMFLLGILQFYDPRIIWGMVAIHYLFSFLLYGKNLPPRLVRKIGCLLDSFKKDTLLNKGLLLFVGLLVLFNLMGSYIPQTGDDALFYHFALPKLFIQHGGLYFYPYNFMSASPFNIEMLFAFGMLLDSDTAANLLNVVVGIAFSLMIYTLVRTYLGHTQGLLWSVVSYSTPFTLAQAHKGFVDFGVGLFATASLYLLLVAIQKKRLNAEIAVFSGIFFGLAAGSKSTGAMAGLVASLALFIVFFRQYGARIIYYSGLVFFFTGLIASPWYLRSAVHTGNPVYPALYSVFDGKYWDHAVERRLKNLLDLPDLNLAPLGRSLKGFAAFPFFLHYPRFVGKWFARENGGGRPASIARTHLSYLSLIFLPFGFLFILRRNQLMKEAAFMGVTSLLFLAGWFFLLTQEDRYLSPLLGVAYLFSAFGLKSIFEDWRSHWLRRVSIGSCALWFLASLGIYSFYYVPKAYGMVHKEEYLNQYDYLHKMVRWVNSNLGRDKKIALLSEMAPYYLDIPYIHIGPAFRLFDYKDGGSLYDFLRREKVTHLFVSQDPSGNYLYTDERGANPNIYLFRSDAPSYQAELARRISAFPIEDLLSDPLKTKLVYDRVETPVIARTPIVLGDPIQVRVYELTEEIK